MSRVDQDIEKDELNLDGLSPLPELFRQVNVINIGLVGFVEDLHSCNAQAIHVDWRPPAAGDADLADLLAEMGA